MVPMWFDKSLRNQNFKRNLLHRKWKKKKIDCRQLPNFIAARANVGPLIKKKKKEFYLEEFNKCIGDSRQLYRLLNELKGIKGKNSSIPVLVEVGQSIDEPKHIAKSLNKFFAEVGPKLRSALKNTSNYELNFESPSACTCIRLTPLRSSKKFRTWSLKTPPQSTKLVTSR